MDNREQAFRQKFVDAADQLGATPEKVVSIKIRDNVGGYREYHELLHALEHEADIRSTDVQGNFQGNAYLVQNAKTKVIIVEHESGLEILYIAGSIASLLGLIPLVLRCWSVIRDHGGRRPADFHRIETRRLASDGHLIEDHSNGLDVPWAAPLSVMNTALFSAAESIDAEIQGLRTTVQELSTRLKVVENAVSGRAENTRPKAGKPSAKKKAKP